TASSRHADTRCARPPPVPSFPTRRSSDLATNDVVWMPTIDATLRMSMVYKINLTILVTKSRNDKSTLRRSNRLRITRNINRINRSEEHTSELQSRENLVCRLLPEKKNSII